MISAQQKFTISPDVVFREIDGEIVLLDMQTENYFGLDEVASHIWQLLDAGSEIESVYDALLSEYDVDGKQLKKDLYEYIEYLLSEGLITPF